MKKTSKKIRMDINVILTFDRPGGKFDDTQEIYDISIPLTAADKKYDAVSFLEKKFFPNILIKCKKYNRSPGDLIKISTCGDWDLYESFTGNTSLPDLDHSCKWYFGMNRLDLDAWEKKLMAEHGFGTAVNMTPTPEMLEHMIAVYKIHQAKMLESMQTNNP